MTLLDRRLGRAIRVAREQRKLTQEQLALRCGISRRHLASIEAGANFSVALLIAIAGELQDVTPAVVKVLQRKEQ